MEGHGLHRICFAFRTSPAWPREIICNIEQGAFRRPHAFLSTKPNSDLVQRGPTKDQDDPNLADFDIVLGSVPVTTIIIGAARSAALGRLIFQSLLTAATSSLCLDMNRLPISPRFIVRNHSSINPRKRTQHTEQPDHQGEICIRVHLLMSSKMRTSGVGCILRDK